MAFRFKHADVKMTAAEEDFEAGGRKFRAGAFIIPDADRAALEPTMKALGLVGLGGRRPRRRSRCTTSTCRASATCTLVEHAERRLGARALDTYGVPYTYFGDIKLREGNLRQKYDVIIFPHVGGNAQSQVNGDAEDRHRCRCRTRRRPRRRISASRIRPTTSAAAWAGKG